MDNRAYARGIAAEIVRTLDALQENTGGQPDGIKVGTRLADIQKTKFPQLWIWPAKVNTAWFLGRMQKVARLNTPPGETTDILYPDTFAKATTPDDVFNIVLKAAKLSEWYNNQSGDARKEIAQ